MNNIKKKCLLENIKLIDLNLCFQSFGNVSLKIDNDRFVIKPSGVDLKKVDYRDFPIISIKSGNILEGKLKPSSDTKTHLILYKKFKNITSIAHTHSKYATIWSQSKKEIPILGTTHADYWNVPIPITKTMNKSEIKNNYELNTGNKIIELMKSKNLDYILCPGVLVVSHGPFTWGQTVEEAVKNAEKLEHIAKLACLSLQLNPITTAIPVTLHHRHYSRKHGTNAYYGQENS